MPITRPSWTTKHALLTILEDERRSTGKPIYEAAMRFVDAMSWYVDETTFDAHLRGFVALPPKVIIQSLGTIDVCTTVARAAIPDDETTVQKILVHAAHGANLS